MLGVVTGIAHWGKEDGLIYLTLVLQAAMYLEMTRVIGGDDSSSLFSRIHKAVWFLLTALAYNAPFMTPWWSIEIAMIVSTLSISAIISAIVHVQYHQRDDVFYRDVVRQAAVSCLSAVRSFVRWLMWVRPTWRTMSIIPFAFTDSVSFRSFFHFSSGWVT